MSFPRTEIYNFWNRYQAAISVARYLSLASDRYLAQSGPNPPPTRMSSWLGAGAWKLGRRSAIENVQRIAAVGYLNQLRFQVIAIHLF